MKVQLDREHVLKADEDQVTLVQLSVTRSGPNAGAIVEKPIGYWRDVPQALEAFCKRKARVSDVTTIREYIDALRETRDEVRAIVEAAA
jgi:hypothetical protein